MPQEQRLSRRSEFSVPSCPHPDRRCSSCACLEWSMGLLDRLKEEDRPVALALRRAYTERKVMYHHPTAPWPEHAEEYADEIPNSRSRA